MVKPAVKAKATMVLNQVKHTEDELCGYDKQGNLFSIEREPDGRFYIQVWCWKNDSHLYDGWWNEYGKTMREAVIEAVEGACLVSERAAKQGATPCE